MKKSSWFDKIIYFLNSLAALILLLAYLLPFISPKSIPEIAILSLGVPILIVINLLFAIYWLVKLNRKALLSTIILIIGFQFLNSFYKVSERKIFLNDELKVMSYNVRIFNPPRWKENGRNAYFKAFSDFFNDKNPDVICFQEYLLINDELTVDYKYKYVHKTIGSVGQAIYSKYKIINSGSLDLKSPNNNNVIFADIVKGSDTIRIYNAHIQSFKISLSKKLLGYNSKTEVKKHFEDVFIKQANHAELLVAHEEKSPYVNIICGDFNNTSFSWMYRKIKGNKNDAFVEAGKGFGKSFKVPFPLRIDFILADEEIKINNFKTYTVDYSDHFPIMARFELGK